MNRANHLPMTDAYAFARRERPIASVSDITGTLA